MIRSGHPARALSTVPTISTTWYSFCLCCSTGPEKRVGVLLSSAVYGVRALPFFSSGARLGGRRR